MVTAWLVATDVVEIAGGLAALIVLWLLPALGVARLAQRRGRPFALWFAASLIVSWVALLIAIVVLPDRSDTAVD